MSECESNNAINVLHVALGETVHLKPHQTRWTKAVVDVQGEGVIGTWMMIPNEEQLATQHCDMAETLLEDVITMTKILLNNWGSCPIVIKPLVV